MAITLRCASNKIRLFLQANGMRTAIYPPSHIHTSIVHISGVYDLTWDRRYCAVQIDQLLGLQGKHHLGPS